MRGRKSVLLVLSGALAAAPAAGLAQSAYGAAPGSVNFAQGQVSIGGRPVDSSKGGLQLGQLRAGDTLATADGSADILLAPGALLRVGEDATVQMVASDRHRTEIRLTRGVANVSANTVRHDDLLLIDMPQGQTQILSNGLYTLNAASNTLRVFNGEAYAFPGADTSADVKPEKVKEGHELVLSAERTKAAKFDRDLADGDVLPWTGPRESQAALADATVRSDGDGEAVYGYDDAGGYTGGGGALGFYGSPYGEPYSGFGYGGGWGPYGFYGYPFFGVGYGYGYGFYGGGYGGFGGYPIGVPIGGGRFHGPVRGPIAGPIHGPVRGPNPHPMRGGFGRGTSGIRGGVLGGGAHSFGGGGGFHGGGGGGFHGGGGHR